MNATRAAAEQVAASSASPDGHAIVIRAEHLAKRFGGNRVLDGIDLVISRGEVVSLMGSSGGGKTTLLRCVNLLEEPTEGVVEVDGEVVSKDGHSLHRARRVQLRQRVGMVFQSFNLFQHLTAAENVALPLLRVARADRDEAVTRELSTQGMTMLIATHEVGFALDVSDRIVFMDRGRIVDAGPPREVVFGSASQRAREFFAGFVRQGSQAG